MLRFLRASVAPAARLAAPAARMRTCPPFVRLAPAASTAVSAPSSSCLGCASARRAFSSTASATTRSNAHIPDAEIIEEARGETHSVASAAAVTKKRATRKTAPKEAQQRAAELSELIRQANALYYGGGQSTLSDAEFDALYLELQQLEARYPALQQRKSSPTQRPGAPAMARAPSAEGEAPAAKKRSAKKKASKDSELGGATTAVPVPHRLPMLSLDSTTSFDKLLAWDASLRKKVVALTGAKAAAATAGAPKTKILPPLPYTLELKYDGIAVSLLYRRNSSGEVRLERVLTRGSGTVGEDVSRAVARWVRGVPQTLTVDWMRGAEEAGLLRFVAEDGALIEVRGEVLLSKSSQASYADFLARYGGEKARAADVGRTPARNLAAGLLRRDVAAEEAAAGSGGEEALDAQGRPAPACLDLVTYSLHFHHPDVRHVTPYLQDPPGTRTVQVGMEHPVPATQSEALEMLRRLGMPTAMPRILASEHGADSGSDNGVVAQFATVHACGDIDRVIDELCSPSVANRSISPSMAPWSNWRTSGLPHSWARRTIIRKRSSRSSSPRSGAPRACSASSGPWAARRS